MIRLGPTFCVVLALGSIGTAQQADPAELPSAPSAVKQQQDKRPAASQPSDTAGGGQPATTPQADSAQANPTQTTPADKKSDRPPAPPAPVPETKPAPTGSTANESPKTAPANPPPASSDDNDSSITTIRSFVNEVNVVFTV